MKEQKVCINLWLVEVIIIDLLEEINAIVTENITSESKKLIELLSKISEITGVNIYNHNQRLTYVRLIKFWIFKMVSLFLEEMKKP